MTKFNSKDNKKDKNNKKSMNKENHTITNIMNSLNKLSANNTKIKEKVETKTKSEEKKKELPPLPNLKIKENTQMNKKDLPENVEKLNNNPTKKENKSFKMDKSFLQDD